MFMPSTQFKTTSQYITTFPKETQVVLKKLRTVLKKVLPKAQLVITYNIPTFQQNDSHVVYFAGFSKHVSLYPTPKSDKTLMKELKPYLHGAGTIQFKLSSPIPYTLVARVARALIKENIARTTTIKKDKRIDQHIAQQPKAVQAGLKLIRKTVTAAAPQAVETINYGVPMFQVNGKNLIGFAASKLFYAVYPSPPVIAAMQKELKSYSQNKGTVRFTTEQPATVALIKKMVKLRLADINAK